MRTTLSIDDELYRAATAEADRQGMTLSQYVEGALRAKINASGTFSKRDLAEIGEQDRVMESLLQATAHFRIGEHPTRHEPGGPTGRPRG